MKNTMSLVLLCGGNYYIKTQTLFRDREERRKRENGKGNLSERAFVDKQQVPPFIGTRKWLLMKRSTRESFHSCFSFYSSLREFPRRDVFSRVKIRRKIVNTSVNFSRTIHYWLTKIREIFMDKKRKDLYQGWDKYRYYSYIDETRAGWSRGAVSIEKPAVSPTNFPRTRNSPR